MNVFGAEAFDQHEAVHFFQDSSSGLRCIIAIHNTVLGPATGGCRMFPYADEAQALDDVLRLSRGMSYKSALAGLPLGGGKAVILGDPATQKTPVLLRAMGRVIESLGGRYLTAEDSGIGPGDLAVLAQETHFVAGLSSAGVDGDPSPYTALGVFRAIEHCVATCFAGADLRGIRVAIQGAGAVGMALLQRLIQAGAEVQVCDVYPERLRLAAGLGARVIGPQDFLSADVDVLSPCAMGRVFSLANIGQIRAPIIAGAANNQLADADVDRALLARGVLYAPDFVINAGGIMKVYQDLQGLSATVFSSSLETIVATLARVLAGGREVGGYQLAAEQIARQRLGLTRQGLADSRQAVG